MLTVIKSLQLSTEYLEKKNIESPRLNSELLLSEILKCKRLDLYRKFDQPLKENEIRIYRDWISRRGKYEPLQYIIGRVEFFGLQFKVNQDVLIPRPETEILVEEVLKTMEGQNISRILDIGAGSGNISICLAKHLENSKITAIDISDKALLMAQENAKLNKVESKISFQLANITDFNSDERFDVIVSNPPYVSMQEYKSIQAEIKYEPAYAVTDYKDGLVFYESITKRATDLLIENGLLFMEIGKGMSSEVSRIYLDNGFRNLRFVKDYQQIDRIIVGELQ